MEVPVVVETFIDDVSSVTYYRVLYSDGRLEDMTQQQFEYLKASSEAVDDLDAKESTTVQPEDPPAPAEPAQNITESPDLRDGYVPQEKELPFEGSLTAYDDRAADTPALYADLPNVSNSFTSIMDWFGDTFFIERTETVHKSGYTSERYSYSGSSQLIQLPYEEDSTTTSQVLNPQACVSALLVVLVFVTTVTWIKNAIWGRMS
mgnify:CR=1 FL=1